MRKRASFHSDFSGGKRGGGALEKQPQISIRLGAGFRIRLVKPNVAQNDRGRSRESMWAYLPVGPLERQFWEGNQGGFWEEVPKNPQERVVAFLWRDIWGSLC